jgi:hypothetical protein
MNIAHDDSKLIEKIKTLVDLGCKVYQQNTGYVVKKDRFGRYNIVFKPNGYTIGLHGRENTEFENKCNGRNFFIIDELGNKVDIDNI